jgi:D-3-phosphoglycerate dehydrogenase
MIPDGNIVCFIYQDRPGVLAEISSGIAEAGINIDDVRNPHSPCGKRSLAMLKVNRTVPQDVIDRIKEKIQAQVAFHVEL